MAQVSSVQREPSMEEILASIRRIIEDSDGARKDLDEGNSAADAGSTGTVDVEAFREELADASPVRPVSLARIHEADIEDEPRLEPRPVGNGWPQPADFVPRSEPETSDQQAEGEWEEKMDEEPQAELSASEPLAPAASGNARPAILSEHAGRQVAASFGELSEVFAASRRKSFDEMAEEMMRPMLQDWLDNNLPLLVERLVREEIERVARGGSR